jgi:hypothetical protein
VIPDHVRALAELGCGPYYDVDSARKQGWMGDESLATYTWVVARVTIGWICRGVDPPIARSVPTASSA